MELKIGKQREISETKDWFSKLQKIKIHFFIYHKNVKFLKIDL